MTRDASKDPELAAELAEAVRGAQRRYVVARVGRLPAGPMGDRRTRRDRDRSSVKRHAIEDQS